MILSLITFSLYKKKNCSVLGLTCLTISGTVDLEVKELDIGVLV